MNLERAKQAGEIYKKIESLKHFQEAMKDKGVISIKYFPSDSPIPMPRPMEISLNNEQCIKIMSHAVESEISSLTKQLEAL